MTPDQIVAALWRRRLLFVSTLVLCLGTVVLVTFLLPSTYRATATLSVNGPDPDEGQGEQFTRTYVALASNPTVASRVLTELPFTLSREGLLDSMAFVPVERTQLLEISAESSSRQRAQLVANAYASVFVRGIQATDGPTSIAIGELASRPIEPVRPNPPIYLAFGGVLALVLATAVVLLREALDRRVRPSATDVALHGEPIVGRIPKVRVTRPDGRARIEDAYRLLRATIDARREERAKVIVVTSAGADEGKSSVAAGLAAVIATDGDRVVLVEADLRRPRLDRALAPFHRLERADEGLAEYLEGRGVQDMPISADPAVGGPHVIWAGAPMTAPGALLASPSMSALIGWLAAHYDRVIIDTPPVSVGPDVASVAGLADGVLFVVDCHQTKDQAARANLHQLREFHAPILGVVVVNVRIRAETEYYPTSRPGDGKPPTSKAARAVSAQQPYADAKASSARGADEPEG